MKFLITLILTTLCFSVSADNASRPLTSSRLVYSSTNVTTGAWVQIYSSVPQQVARMEVFDSSGQTMEIGVGPASGEARLFIVTPGGNGAVPVSIPKSARVAVRAISGTASSGELSINYYQ